MKISAKNIATSILAIAFLTACSGGRSKQAVQIEPAPGSKQPASDPDQQQQQQNTQQQQQQQQQQEQEQEQANPGAQGQVPGGADPGSGVQPPSTPGSQGGGNNGNGNNGGSGNGTTDLSIEAVLDDSVAGGGTPPSVTPGTTTVGTWDGKSFKGSGKWKVDPVN